jgi:hypothetical protein
MKMFNKKLIFILPIIIVMAFCSLPNFVHAATGDTEVVFGNEPLFSEINFVPGQAVSRWVKFKNNTGNILTAATKAIQVSNPDGFGDWFDILIEEGSTERYSGTLTEYFNANEIMLSNVAGEGTQVQYDFTITMKTGAGNDTQGKTLSFDIQVGVGSKETIGDEPGGGGGGGSVYNGLLISEEKGIIVEGINNITISWLTNHSATSRVVFDNISHATLDLPPNYGYQWSTPETDNSPMVTGHSVLVDLNSLSAGTYYFRPISHGSPEVIGKEVVFIVNSVGEVEKIIQPEYDWEYGLEDGEVLGDQDSQAPSAGGEIFPVEKNLETRGVKEIILKKSNQERVAGDQDQLEKDESRGPEKDSWFSFYPLPDWLWLLIGFSGLVILWRILLLFKKK